MGKRIVVKIKGELYECTSEAERLACTWARENVDDPAYDSDPRWELVWSINARAIQDSLQRERAFFTERRPPSMIGRRL